jgi:hypothetical protein
VRNQSILVPRKRLSPWRKLALSAEILFAYVRARRVLGRRTLPNVVAAMRCHRSVGAPAPEDAYTVALRLGAAATRVLGMLPRDPRCLTRALVLSALLARRGIASRLVIAVRRDPFGAHAWVEHGGRPILPSASAPFERLFEV